MLAAAGDAGHYKYRRRMEHDTLLYVALSPANKACLLDIARGALLEEIDSVRGDRGFWCPIGQVDPELTAPAGCFVSLHHRLTRQLLGCVGRLDTEQPLWDNVRETARAVLHDPRFANQRIRWGDIPNLVLEISVLSPPRQAASPLDFELLRDGIHLVIGGRSGFFLPQVARDTGWTPEQLLDRLCTEKLSLPANAWRSPDARLHTFIVEVVGPEAV
jgi:AmmeMemoRadiSam system protein A